MDGSQQQGSGGSASDRIAASAIDGGVGADAGDIRVAAVVAVARHWGMEIDPKDYRATPGELVPSPASLVAWLRECGMWAKADKLRWKQLMRMGDGGPVVLLFTDGSAGLLHAVDPNKNVVLLRDPRLTAGDPLAVDELRLSQIWAGEVVLIRRERSAALEDEPFNMGLLLRMVGTQKGLLRNIGVASLTITVLHILPTFLIMVVIDKVLVYRSMSTLAMLVMILIVAVTFETILGWSKRICTAFVATRLDIQLNLFMFNRLLKLTLDYFEHHQAGETMYKVNQIQRIREFMAGKMLATLLDMMTLIIVLPFLFWLAPFLAWIVLATGALIALVVLAFMRSVQKAMGAVVKAEIERNSTLIETIQGIRTIKSLALEPPRRVEWDERIAASGAAKLNANRVSNVPQTIITPLERFIEKGAILVGTYMALSDNTGLQVGSLVAFMMLSRQVAGPLVGFAKLMEDYEEVRLALHKVAEVMNSPTETNAASGGLKPEFAGALQFQDVTFVYPRTKTPALDRVSFEIPPGTMLGVVGRSGSGKSTITRLLQGITRDYSGFLKIDGADLREINLRHMRRSFGVVLQENFLFRGTIRDNIIGGRPGLTLDDVVRAARLAGAEEFIERMPGGYETFIEEGSPNLSGGQRQRLAIARALIHDPRILILDEATSALDPESEALVNANLLRIARGRTMVIVSHRLSSLTDCDLTLVMERGHVADIAPHRVLLERCDIYKQLWMQQNRHMENQGPRHGSPAPVLLQGD